MPLECTLEDLCVGCALPEAVSHRNTRTSVELHCFVPFVPAFHGGTPLEQPRFSFLHLCGGSKQKIPNERHGMGQPQQQCWDRAVSNSRADGAVH